MADGWASHNAAMLPGQCRTRETGGFVVCGNAPIDFVQIEENMRSPETPVPSRDIQKITGPVTLTSDLLTSKLVFSLQAI